MTEEKLRNQHLTISLGTNRSGDKTADGDITGADGSLLINDEMRRIQAANANGKGEIIIRTVVRGCGFITKLLVV